MFLLSFLAQLQDRRINPSLFICGFIRLDVYRRHYSISQSRNTFSWRKRSHEKICCFGMGYVER